MFGTSAGRPRALATVALALTLGLSAPVACARAPVPAPGAAGACGPAWVTGWLAADQAVPGDQLAGRTLRMQIRPQADGSRVRVRLSNRYGDGPLGVGAATLARGGAGAAADAPIAVRFAGRPDVTVPAGQAVLSDEVPVPAVTGAPLAVSLFLSEVPRRISSHPVAMQTAYLSGPGDATTGTSGAGYGTTLQSWPVLSGLDVLADRPAAALVLVGDSIVDGVGSTPDGQDRLTDVLAARLRGAGGDRVMTVLNAGLSRNQLLDDDPSDGGDSPRSRFDDDLAGDAAARDVLLLAGTNDVEAGASAAEIVAGLTRFADRVRASGRRVFLTTILPSTLAGRGTPRGIAVRDQVNAWVRTRGPAHADGVVDLAAVAADPSDPRRLRPGFDSGDGLHPSPAGYRALAEAIPVGAFSGSPCRVGRPPVAKGP